MINFFKKKFVVVTHDGTFHTDDVFACAVILLAHKDKHVQIVRSRDESVISSADCVVDVGGIYDPHTLRFDHHQKEGAGTRDSGIPYASFGLVWKEYGASLAGSVEVAKTIDERLVAHIDAVDTGVAERDTLSTSPYSVGDIIGGFRPTWEENEKDIDVVFGEAVLFAKQVLSRIIAHATSAAAARSTLERAYSEASDKRIIVIEKEYPGWYEVMAQYSEPLYVVYERTNGSWGVKGVRIDPADFATRKPFPEEWAGARDEELQTITGVPDAVFCHTGRFLVVAESKEGALLLAQKALIL